MAKLTLYVADDNMAYLKQAKKLLGMSLSSWFAQQIHALLFPKRPNEDTTRLQGQAGSIWLG